MQQSGKGPAFQHQSSRLCHQAAAACQLAALWLALPLQSMLTDLCWQGPGIGVRQCSDVVIADNVVVHYPEHDGGYSSIQVDAVTEVSRFSTSFPYIAGRAPQLQGCTVWRRLTDCMTASHV